MRPMEPDPSAPRTVDHLPDYWNARRRFNGKPDESQCAADLRQALESRNLAPMPWWQRLVIVSAIFVLVWSGVRMWVLVEPRPPVICVCPEPSP